MMCLALRRFGKQVFKVAAAGLLAVVMLTSAGCSILYSQCIDVECVTAPPSPPLEDVITQYYPLFTAYTQALKDRGLVSGDGATDFEVWDGCVRTFDGDAGYQALDKLDLSGQASVEDLENAGTDIFEPYGVNPLVIEDDGFFRTVTWTRFKDDTVGGVAVSVNVRVADSSGVGGGTEISWGTGCHMSNRSWTTWRRLDPVTLEPLSSASPTPSTAETPR